MDRQFDELVRDLTERYRARFQIGKPDALEDEAMMDAEDAAFPGDYEALWTAVKAALSEGPIVHRDHQQAQPGGGRRAPREEKPFTPAPWEQSDNDLITAPYRFAALSPQVSLLADDEAETSLARPAAGNLCAVLDVTWAVETPILIGDRKDENDADTPFKLGEEWAIPGATLRGMIRSELETAAFGRLFQTNRHRRFALRDFNHPVYRDFITKSVKDLKAGWLTKTDAGPSITPCEWGYLRIEDLIDSTDDDDVKDWVTQDRAGKYQDHDWTTAQAFTETGTFAFVETDKSHRRIFRPGAGRDGVAVFSGRIPGGKKGKPKKRFEYVFFDTAAQSVSLTPTAWDAFETLNSKPSKNKRDPDGAWKELKQAYDAGGRVPVFYTGDLGQNGTDPDFSFGLTRLYRRPHRYSVGDILARTKPDGIDKSLHLPGVETIVEGRTTLKLRPDFVEHLFGYVYEPDELEFGQSAVVKKPEYNPPNSHSRKGRVAFGFARASDNSAFRIWPDTPIATVMGAPKPSFAPFYLVGREKDYSSDHARLAGRKRYIARHVEGHAKPALKAALEAQIATAEIARNKEVQTRLQFLAPESGATFEGRIKLHNVSEAELGAILWALTFGGDRDARHLVGRAKPFGAGQLRVEAIRLQIRPNGAAPQAPVDWRHADGRDKIGTWLDGFETRIADLAGLDKNRPHAGRDGVRDLLTIARPRGWTAPGSHYLPYQVPGEPGQAQDFARLRKKTGAGAARLTSGRPPDRLLPP